MTATRPGERCQDHRSRQRHEDHDQKRHHRHRSVGVPVAQSGGAGRCFGKSHTGAGRYRAAADAVVLRLAGNVAQPLVTAVAVAVTARRGCGRRQQTSPEVDEVHGHAIAALNGNVDTGPLAATFAPQTSQPSQAPTLEPHDSARARADDPGDSRARANLLAPVARAQQEHTALQPRKRVHATVQPEHVGAELAVSQCAGLTRRSNAPALPASRASGAPGSA